MPSPPLLLAVRQGGHPRPAPPEHPHLAHLPRIGLVQSSHGSPCTGEVQLRVRIVSKEPVRKELGRYPLLHILHKVLSLILLIGNLAVLPLILNGLQAAEALLFLGCLLQGKCTASCWVYCTASQASDTELQSPTIPS